MNVVDIPTTLAELRRRQTYDVGRTTSSTDLRRWQNYVVDIPTTLAELRRRQTYDVGRTTSSTDLRRWQNYVVDRPTTLAELRRRQTYDVGRTTSSTDLQRWQNYVVDNYDVGTQQATCGHLFWSWKLSRLCQPVNPTNNCKCVYIVSKRCVSSPPLW